MRVPLSAQAIAAASVAVFIALLPLKGAGAGERLEVADVLAAIRRQIEAVRASAVGPPVARIASVDIELAVTTTTGIDGQLKLWLVTASGERKLSEVSTLRLTFEPKGTIDVGAERLPLAQAIRSAKAAIREAEEKEPGFGFTRFDYTFQIAIEKTAKGELDISILGGDVEKGKENAHKVVVHMVKVNS